jgi:single-stranded-DNA-specific exonuclease
MRGVDCRWVRRDPGGGAGDLLDRVLAARGLAAPEERAAYLDPTSAMLHPAELLPGVEAAADRILAAVKAKERIAVYGDYDCDGVTSTAILMRVLRGIDPDVEVESYLPHRLKEGYGLNAAALESLRDRGVGLAITVDCGVTAVAEAERCREIGLGLIITDHHHVAAGALPRAEAIVHPGLPGSAYPWPILSGSAVAYKLARHLVAVHEGSDAVSERMKPLLRDALCLAGLGVIADLVPLVGENRRIAAKSLRLMRGCTLPGVAAMLLECVRKGESVDSETVGYRIGPRLNASGRLGHAQESLDLLLTGDQQEARKLAASLTAVNSKRQQVARDVEREACAAAEAAGMTGPDHRMIVLSNEAWHPGVVGLVCSKLVDRYARPTVLLGSTDAGVLRGSARSIDGYSIYDALQACRAHLRDFGGHTMAAGMSIDASRFESARTALLDHAAAHLAPSDLVRTLTIDTEASLREMTMPAVESLQRMQPFGRGNENPLVLLRDVRVESSGTMGARSAHLELRLKLGSARSNETLRAPWFGHGALEKDFPRGVHVDAVVEPKISFWRGKNVELIIRDLHRC